MAQFSAARSFTGSAYIHPNTTPTTSAAPDESTYWPSNVYLRITFLKQKTGPLQLFLVSSVRPLLAGLLSCTARCRFLQAVVTHLRFCLLCPAEAQGHSNPSCPGALGLGECRSLSAARASALAHEPSPPGRSESRRALLRLPLLPHSGPLQGFCPNFTPEQLLLQAWGEGGRGSDIGEQCVPRAGHGVSVRFYLTRRYWIQIILVCNLALDPSATCQQAGRIDSKAA